MRTFVLLLIMFSTVHHSCYSCYVEDSIYEELQVDQVIHAVPKDIVSLLDNFDLLTGDGIYTTFENLKTYMIQSVQVQFRQAINPVLQTFLIIILCSIFLLLISEKNYEFLITVIGGTAIAYLNLSDTKSYFSVCVDTIQELYDFSSVLLPCLAGASVFTGTSMSAGIKYTAAALFMNILLNISNILLVPIVSVYLVCMLGDTIFHQPILGSVSTVIQKLCNTVLTGSVVLFTTYLSVAGLISGTSEMMAARITKSTLSHGLPIVGRIISDTASTLVAGASMIRNGIGVFGMLALIGMLVMPFVSVGMRYLLFKVMSYLGTLFPNQHLSGLMKGISAAYGMMLAIIGSGFVMLFFTVLSFLQVTGVS